MQSNSNPYQRQPKYDKNSFSLRLRLLKRTTLNIASGIKIKLILFFTVRNWEMIAIEVTDWLEFFYVKIIEINMTNCKTETHDTAYDTKQLSPCWCHHCLCHRLYGTDSVHKSFEPNQYMLKTSLHFVQTWLDHALYFLARFLWSILYFWIGAEFHGQWMTISVSITKDVHVNNLNLK